MTEFCMKYAGVIVCLLGALATHVEAAEIKVISTGGARAVMTSIVPEFERRSGHKVSIDSERRETCGTGLFRAKQLMLRLGSQQFCPILKRPARSHPARAWNSPPVTLALRYAQARRRLT